jgi:hypothetical protein
MLHRLTADIVVAEAHSKQWWSGGECNLRVVYRGKDVVNLIDRTVDMQVWETRLRMPTLADPIRCECNRLIRLLVKMDFQVIVNAQASPLSKPLAMR